MAKILVIEDDRTIAELLQAALQHEGDEVCLSLQGSLDALDETYDLVLLDLMLPDADGLELARLIRGSYDLPIIMLTARGELRDKVAGFEAGADDYVTKPFSFQELSARVHAVLKRTGRGGGQIRAGALCLDPDQRRAWWHDRPLELSARQFDLLAALTRRPGRVFSRDELINRVWGVDFEGESNVVEVTVGRLRDNLGDHAHTIIATVRGIGYTLRIP
ncbi:MAG: response regulator transcription factor [Bacillati bacterium ANGP1]|uniref:Response regulator transcription factor n=1 Tax=Candidatus Segetimicrobium genomatis TaxID=2569760 RepID=A0A537IRI8_9BACT|nr:MAG: response regulator transcription factor [Terrabacteria group bacterium ANGP1]